MNTEFAKAQRKAFHDRRTPNNIKALYAQGLSPQQIADKACCHVNHVRKILNIAVPIAKSVEEELPNWQILRRNP